MSRFSFIILLSSLITGCAQIQPKAGFEEIEQTVSTRLDKQILWSQNSEEDQAVQNQIQQLLQQDLSADSAVQIALLNNKSLQATYENMGIAQAEVVRAGLLKNPVFSFAARFPNEPPSSANLEFDLIGDFLNLLMLPAKKHFAEQQFEQVRLDVADQVLTFATSVKKHFYALQSAQQSVLVLNEITTVSEVSFELAQKFYEAGNIDELQLTREQALYETARLNLAQKELEVAGEREQLEQLLSLSHDQKWNISSSLDAVPAEHLMIENLEKLAIEQRLDLQAAGKEVEASASRLGIKRNWRLLAGAEFGISGEREPDGMESVGPALSVEVPLFDQGQTEVAEADAHLRQSEHKLTALVLQIRSEVRSAQNKMIASQQMAHRYQSTIIPLQERIVTLSQQRYNYMLLGAFDLLTARQDEMKIYQDYIHAVRDFWIARSDLERAVGGNFPLIENTKSMDMKMPEENSTSTPSDDHKHHGGH